MTAATKLETVSGYIVAKFNSTRMRKLPQTFSTTYKSWPMNTKVVIDQTLLYLETDPLMPTAIHERDLWGRVVSINGIPLAQIKDDLGNPIVGEAWMAIVYIDQFICDKFYVVVADPGVPPVQHTYPQKIHLSRFLLSPESVDGVILPPKYYFTESPLTFTLDPNQDP